MTEQQHPITPPPELVQQWLAEIWHEGTPVRVAASDLHVATQAAQWGADQELEACCEWLFLNRWDQPANELHAARRPKPPSLKEQGRQALERISNSVVMETGGAELHVLKAIVESLPD